MTKYKTSLIYTILFSTIITIFAIYDIRSGYNKELSDVHYRVANKSFLIEEWIKSAFIASDYVLLDVINGSRLTDLKNSNQNPIQQAKTTNFLKSKIETLPDYFKEFGITNKDCLATSAYVVAPRKSFIGVDFSDREWCKELQKDNNITQYITPMFLGSTGKMIVSQGHAIRNSNSEFCGVAGLIVELNFFQQWLEQISIAENEVLAISDTNLMLLARKPALTNKLGVKVDDKIVEEFLASNENYKSFNSLSPLDGINRVYGVRKVGNLPFLIVVGEAHQDWLKSWKQKTYTTVIIVIMFWILSILILRNHWKQLLLHEKLDNLAHTDELTGISNRRDFITKANQELNRIQRYKTEMAFLMLDIDKFKLINDNNGHLTGDRAIIEFTKVCKKAIRDIDVLGRLGGDEFAILLVDTTIEEAHKVTERILTAIESCEVFNDKGEAISMTSSIGVVMVDSQISSVNDMIAMADEALYMSKEKGRNRIEFA